MCWIILCFVSAGEVAVGLGSGLAVVASKLGGRRSRDVWLCESAALAGPGVALFRMDADTRFAVARARAMALPYAAAASPCGGQV